MLKTLSIPLHFLAAVSQLLFNGRIRSCYLIPFLLGLVSFFLFGGLALVYRSELLSLVLSIFGWNLEGGSVNWFVGILFFLVSLIPAAVMAYLVLMALSGFYFEEMVLRALGQAGFFPPEEMTGRSQIVAIIRGLRDDLLRVCFLGVVLIVSILVSFFPPLYVIPIGISAFLAGFDMLDLPLLLLGYSFDERLKLYRSHLLQVLSFGGMFLLLLVTPPLFLIAVPVGYLAAVRVIRGWDKTEGRSSSLLLNQ